MTSVRKLPDSEQIGFVPEGDIGRRARRGAFWSAGQILLRNLVSMGTTAVLARLLLPEDYGLIGMVATLTAALLVVSDMGLSWATVQRKDLTQAQVNNLFWLNVAAGAAIWLVCIALAPTVSGFYGRNELGPIVTIMGASFLISGLAVQPLALMRRAMDFRSIALIQIVAVVAGSLTAIVLALSGTGYWALVAQGLVTASVRASLVLYASRWRLASPKRGVGTWQLVNFGGLLAINGLLFYLARNLDSVLIGKFWGAVELGIYNRAYFLMLLPSVLAKGVLTGLMVSSLSALQHDKDRFGSAFRRALRLVAYIGTPMAVGLALTAEPAVELIYGPGWGSVSAILVWLSLAGITQPIVNSTGWLFTSLGKGRAYLLLTLLSSVLLSAVFLVTVHAGVESLAKWYGITMGLIIPLPALWFAHHISGIPLAPSLRLLAPVALLNALMAGIVCGVGIVLEAGEHDQLLVFAVQVVTGTIVYLVLTPVLLAEMWSQDLKTLVNRKKVETMR